MRVLALDYGSARCGCALSDLTGTVATPIDAVERPGTRRGLQRLRALVREREVGRVVVGLPLSLSGEDSEQTREARAFAERLAEVLGPGVPVELYDERLTTVSANRSMMEQNMRAAARRRIIDKVAAAVMLQSWLESQAAR